MKKNSNIIKINKSNYNFEKLKESIEIEDEFWKEDEIDINYYDYKNNINNKNSNKNKNKQIIKENNIIKNTNKSIIIKKALNDKLYYNNYFGKINNRIKKSNNPIKIRKSGSAVDINSKNVKTKRFDKLYQEGLISIKKRVERSMEEKIKKENEYKKYSFSPIFYSHSPIGGKNIGKKKQINENKDKIISNQNKISDIYERNRKWQKTIEDKNIKQRLLKKKNTETKINFKPLINDCIMKTDESFINKNSIEYQAFIEKLNLIKNKENIYGQNQKNNNNFYNNYNTKPKPRYSIEISKKNKSNKNKENIKEMNKFKSFNNRSIFNILSCRSKYGLNDFFNSNNYDTISSKNNIGNNYNFNGNDLLNNKKQSDMNELFFNQQAFNSQQVSTNRMKQTCFNFNDALLKLNGKMQ